MTTFPSLAFQAVFDAGADWASSTTKRPDRDEAVQQAWDEAAATTPATWPVEPARDLPAAIDLLERTGVMAHPYDGVLYRLAARTLRASLKATEDVDETDPSLHLTTAPAAAEAVREATK